MSSGVKVGGLKKSLISLLNIISSFSEVFIIKSSESLYGGDKSKVAKDIVPDSLMVKSLGDNSKHLFILSGPIKI